MAWALFRWAAADLIYMTVSPPILWVPGGPSENMRPLERISKLQELRQATRLKMHDDTYM